jgi:hypothetical protein
MSTEIGRLVQVGLGRESVARGTPAAAGFWMAKVDFDFNPRADLVVNDSGLGVIDARNDAKVVEKVGEGSFGGIVNDKSFGILLAACLGTWSTGTITDTTYTHTFTRLNNNQHPSFTLYHKDLNVEERYPMAMLNQLTINAVLKDYVRFSAGFMSKIGAATTGNTPAYTAENIFLATHATVKFADTVAALGTASATAVRAINLTFNKNVEDLQSLGSVDPTDIVNKAFSVSGDIEMLYGDTVFRDYALAGTKKACLITISNTDALLGTASYPTLTITLSPMSLRDWGRSTGQDDVVLQTLAFDGNFSITDSATVSATLKNTQASY